MFADTPKPPYYAVIFTSKLNDDPQGYNEMSDHIEELVKGQDGYLGMESARKDIGITVSYWRDMESIKKWSANLDHREAKKEGRERWYKSYRVRISKVEMEY